MEFLTTQDFKTLIKDKILDDVIQADETILDDMERMAIGEMSSYLKRRFDTTAIFAARNEERNPVIILKLLDIVIYHLHSRINPRQIPDLRVERYENAIKWLQDVAKDIIDPDLPTVEREAGGVISWGSEPKRNPRW